MIVDQSGYNAKKIYKITPPCIAVHNPVGAALASASCTA
jgi:hypothetical protein